MPLVAVEESTLVHYHAGQSKLLRTSRMYFSCILTSIWKSREGLEYKEAEVSDFFVAGCKPRKMVS